jgi:hypothetical protein
VTECLSQEQLEAVSAHAGTRPIVRDLRPGLNRQRMLRLMEAAVARTALDLSGLQVLTEAASGAYAATPVLAAMAGAAGVCALARSSRYGTAEEVGESLLQLARSAGVEASLDIVTALDASRFGRADIVTNSGHLRPLDEPKIGLLKPSAVIPLMYESWELRESDVDLQACRRRGIRVGGTNERHPSVDVFSFLGVMAIRLLHEAGIAVRGSSLLVLCDNDFADSLEETLRANGAACDLMPGLPAGLPARRYDAALVALRPGPGPFLRKADALRLADHSPGCVVAQFWGDVDRTALREAGLPAWPAEAPPAGHMGVLPSAVGPEAIVRLQSGGLKVGEVLARGTHETDAQAAAYVQLL